MNKYKGFTVVECLIALSLCSFLLFFSLDNIKKWQNKLEVEQFFSSFEKTLLFTQQMAIVECVDTHIFFSEKEKVEFLTSNEQYVLKIPSSLSASGPDRITFKRNSGNNGRLAKFSFEWAEKKEVISFQFQLGSGRYVKKVSSF